MQNPLFSIVIVVFNGVTTIEKAIQSVLNQTYSNFELVIIDGLSTDGTLEIIQKYLTTDSRIKCISEPDKGIYDAMNKGIDNSHGGWLYFLGSDDELYDKFVLENVSNELINSPVDILYGDVVLTPQNRKYDGQFSYEKLLEKNISHQAIFYHRTLFQRIGKYQIRYRMHADWHFNITCFQLNGITHRYLNRIIALFFCGGTSAGHDVTFLQEILLPTYLTHIEQKPDYLKSVRKFDILWRMFRNAKVTSIDTLNVEFDNKLSVVYQRILFLQRLLNRVNRGAISKLFMLLCYVRNRF